ncbi:MAG: SUF system NifU family Fe-S cluster assembly protein [Acholeplasmataceae bacterium]|jgi:SUF system NifU family Fe-S assembly protein|nr:SUF system NifU family Fe-S cluster assembly protein [Acholeplasmataceae bacterium]
MKIENLYRQIIMEHYKNPLNKGLLSDADYLLIKMHNPSCGDDVTVQLKVEDNIIKDIRHDGVGCSICCSSASVMSEVLKGLSKEEAIKIAENFIDMVMNKEFNPNYLKGDMQAYSGVRTFPARVRCATLAWVAALKGLKEG